MNILYCNNIIILVCLMLCASCEPKPKIQDVNERDIVTIKGADKVAALVPAIERMMVMPSGAYKISRYSRFYANGMYENRPVIKGVYLFGSLSSSYTKKFQAIPKLENTYITESDHLPLVLDGGCSVVTLYFDIEKQALILLPQYSGGGPAFGQCNGLA